MHYCVDILQSLPAIKELSIDQIDGIQITLELYLFGSSKNQVVVSVS